MTRITPRSLALPALAGLAMSLLSTLPAGAHGGAGATAIDGALHPLLGLDHLLLLVGVGAAASRDGRLLPAALVGALLGGVIGAFGGALPAGETLAALSVSALGLWLLLRGRLAPASPLLQPLAGALVAASMAIHALLHGQPAHGQPFWWIGASLSAVGVVGLSFALLRRAGARTIGGLALLLALGGLALALLPQA